MEPHDEWIELGGEPRLLVSPDLWLRLGWSFAKAVQQRVPSPPWQVVLLGVTHDNLAYFVMSLVRGPLAVLYRCPLEDLQYHARPFFEALPSISDELYAQWQARAAEFVAEGNLIPD